ncbi:LysM peptidoglycan-binding domain-containing protein [Microbacterium sp. Mu-80]|uniref:LysM peptidoglycan-binding domain-containing protein n=1 Tax=Microbacterium bandirmense TaxID=3122050 RepID=A0ABU8L724_9MICO
MRRRLVPFAVPLVALTLAACAAEPGTTSASPVPVTTQRPASSQQPATTQEPATAEGPPALTPPPDGRPEQSDTDGDGLIYAGNGTWFSADGPGGCASNAAIHPYGAHDPRAQLGGELVDMGASDLASGEVGYNADGLIETYTVESGDSLIAIGERFCIDYVTVGAYNDRFGPKQIQPGDVLILRP